ncbi:MAG: hypothetical protein COB36_11815 [Alphaproteobacteria bacterium]|nr:MAG: hypothetical protein COB36_11815 [Alphaproteobacteria bacterium]
MVFFCSAYADDYAAGGPLPPWSEGMLDIYHINTGRGDSAFFIFPDGTTMLFDAGDLDGEEFEERAYPLKLSSQRPSESVTPGELVAKFIKKVFPLGEQAQIDYALISHFHGDHYGTVRPGLVKSQIGSYVLTGITEVGEEVPIRTLIDRGYPEYNSPVDLKSYHGGSFENYLEFQKAQQSRRGMKVELLEAGSAEQIILKSNSDKYPDFEVRNIKSSANLWTGKEGQSSSLYDPAVLLNNKGKYTENPLSLAIKVSYGNFDYFTGGDMTGLQEPGIAKWFDVETPTAKVVGEVDVLALNHHGNRDATNANFLGTLQPRVIVQQSWTSDHPGSEVLHRMVSQHIWKGDRDIFSTNMAEETKVAIGPWMTRAYSSFEGHIVIRVNKGGTSYQVFVLNDTDTEMRVKEVYGPYESR